MKHLKNYKIFERHEYRDQEAFNVLDDMALELLDDGFNFECLPGTKRQIITLRDTLTNDYKYITVEIKKNKRFNPNDIKSVFLNMVKYMESDGYSVGRIEVSHRNVANMIPVELKGENLYLKYSLKGELDYPICELVIDFEK